MAARRGAVESLDLTLADLRAAYAGRDVLLTGHSGFKGSWLALWLHRLGARVHGFGSPPPTAPSNYEASGVAGCLASCVEADLRDDAALRRAFEAARPAAVFHLAAQPIVRESYRTPRETFETNVMGTVAVLEAVRLSQRPAAVVVVTSDKCYHNREQAEGYREDDPLGGKDPYSASKGAAEIVAASYRASFFPPERLAGHGVALATARAGNVIGGGDWAADRILPDAARALSQGQPVPVRNPASVRPWQHVLEPLSGYLTLGAMMLARADAKWCSAWNFGPNDGDDRDVRALVEIFCKAWGGGRWEDRSDPKALPEAKVLRLSIEKARRDLGWRPRWSTEEAVARTAQWYRAYYAAPAQGARAACMNDLSAYEQAWS
ncbi:MAG: CDP-glucose 4,6-dehydratase [Planctomycetota bacterium]|nr:CDP-glucose 4,6-dehydratase [Planctomycetota bacterium]